MTDIPDGVAEALEHLRPLFPPTPCVRNEHLSARHGAEVILKREDLTPVRSYKIRGAFTAMRRRGADAYVCASAGNHAQGVAWAAHHLGVRAEIYMPVTTPAQKRMKTSAFGGDAVRIVLVGDTYDECAAAARARSQDGGLPFLSPFDDPDVIEGQATVTAEILAQAPEAEMLVMPVGGGGLSAGARRVLDAQAAAPELRLVEPETAPSLRAALMTGGPHTLPKINNFVDGAAVARIGDLPYEALRAQNPSDITLVPEDRLCGTIIEMLNVEGIVLEPAGALAVDALGHLPIAGRRVVAVTTGGNFDFERLPEVKERAERFAGIKRYYVLQLPQRPGALSDFLKLLGPADNIARFEYLKKSARTVGTVLIGVESDAPASLDALEARVAERYAFQNITENPLLADFLI